MGMSDSSGLTRYGGTKGRCPVVAGIKQWERKMAKTSTQREIQSQNTRVVEREKEEDELRRGRRGYLYPRDPGRKVIKDGRITAAVTAGDIHGAVVCKITLRFYCKTDAVIYSVVTSIENNNIVNMRRQVADMESSLLHPTTIDFNREDALHVPDSSEIGLWPP